MAKMSSTVKEIIKTVLFLLVVGILLTAFVIYPLNTTSTILARADIDEFNQDTLLPNDPSVFIEAGLLADTLRIEADGLTNLATIYIPADSLVDTVRGTVIVLHADNQTRDSQLPLIKQLHDIGFVVIAYDQRASGLSTGKYRAFGINEANDVEEVIAYLSLREKITLPLTIVGFETGADAAMIAATEDSRISKVVAVDPFLTVENCLERQYEKHGLYWIPFANSVYFWWYKQRSGNAPEYTDSANKLQLAGSINLLYNGVNGPDELYQQLSGSETLTLLDYNENEALTERIASLLTN